MTSSDQKAPKRHAVFLLYDGVQILDVAGPAQAMTTVNEDLDAPAYEVRTVALHAGPVVTVSGIPLMAEPLAVTDDIPVLDMLIIPGGPGIHAARKDPAFCAAFTALAARARRVCTICTGAFLAAETGMLDGRKAVTHWRSCDRLAREFPDVRVDPRPLFINDGHIWTTAGVTAGIDLMLELIRRDHGDGPAARVARRLVVCMRRPGGQAQYSAPMALQFADAEPFAALFQAVASDPAAAWTVERMAETAGQSVRTFQRRFTASAGTSPALAVEKVRSELARTLLHTTDLCLESIAARTGFGSGLRLRRALTRQYGIGPTELRERFSA